MQFAYNNSINSVTEITLYYANYRRKMKAFWTQLNSKYQNISAQLNTEEMKQLHDQMTRDLWFIQTRMQKYYDKQHENVSEIWVKQKVYLLRKNLKTKRQSNKLNFKRLELYKILEKTESVNFKLKLSQSSKIYSVFHTAVLESASDKISEVNIMNAEEYKDQEYTVERILSKQELRKQKEYLVKWKNYDNSENSWESVESLTKT